jgi:hypothetical protein
MNDMSLFEKKERTLDGPAKYNVDTYQYYNDSARQDMEVIRQLLEKWFSHYPDDEKQDLKTRFQASFDAAFYELYIYTLFTKLGFSLSIHPDIPGTL